MSDYVIQFPPQAFPARNQGELWCRQIQAVSLTSRRWAEQRVVPLSEVLPGATAQRRVCRDRTGSYTSCGPSPLAPSRIQCVPKLPLKMWEAGGGAVRGCHCGGCGDPRGEARQGEAERAQVVHLAETLAASLGMGPGAEVGEPHGH